MENFVPSNREGRMDGQVNASTGRRIERDFIDSVTERSQPEARFNKLILGEEYRNNQVRMLEIVETIKKGAQGMQGQGDPMLLQKAKAIENELAEEKTRLFERNQEIENLFQKNQVEISKEYIIQ